MATSDPERARDLRLRRLYNITAAQYDELLAFQGGHCAICPRLPGKTRLAVDHDHKTGRTRGLLCWRCNGLIGKGDDDPDLMESAARYLRKPPAVELLGEIFGRIGRVTNKRRKRRTTKRR